MGGKYFERSGCDATMAVLVETTFSSSSYILYEAMYESYFFQVAASVLVIKIAGF